MYEQDSLSALDAITEAQRIAFAPMLFQTALCLRNAGVLTWLDKQGKRGATLDALVYAVTRDEGIVKVTGEVGSGKTMLCRMLLERLPPHVETLYLANPSLSRQEILGAIADELGIPTDGKATHSLTRALQDALSQHIPDAADRARVHAIIYDELCLGRLLDSSRAELLAIVDRLAAQGAQGVVLGCTELPLLLQPGDCTLPSFDTTELHARAAVAFSASRMSWPSSRRISESSSRMPISSSTIRIFAIFLRHASLFSASRRRMRTSAPPPSRLLRRTSPPCSSTIFLTIARPRPVPRDLVVK